MPVVREAESLPLVHAGEVEVMRLHLLSTAALLLIALVFAGESHPSETCGKWSKKVAFVSTAWAASNLCEHPDWKPGPVLLHTLSMGARINLYPWQEIGEPSCIAFIETAVEEAEHLFKTDPQRCENVNAWLNDAELRERLIWLGVAD
jgi:hypothetical protein